MTQDDAFFQAILENPDDDSLRLIYADWLEEQGNPRGEFIRSQVLLSQQPEDDLLCKALQLRERELLRIHGAEWVRPFRGRVACWAFRRGFVEKVVVGTCKFLTQAPELFRLAPIRHVSFRRATYWFRQLTESPYLSRLAGIDITDSLLDGLNMDWLAATRLDRLATLNLRWNRIGVNGARALLARDSFPNLTNLSLASNHLGAAGAMILARSVQGCRLTTLDLSYNSITDAGLAALAGSPHLANLTTLHLGNNQLTNAGAEALASSEHLRALQVLDLSWNRQLGDDGVAALARSANLAQLTRLNLRGTVMSVRGADALAESTHLSRLARLTLPPELPPRGRQSLQRRFGTRACRPA